MKHRRAKNKLDCFFPFTKECCLFPISSCYTTHTVWRLRYQSTQKIKPGIYGCLATIVCKVRMPLNCFHPRRRHVWYKTNKKEQHCPQFHFILVIAPFVSNKLRFTAFICTVQYDVFNV